MRTFQLRLQQDSKKLDEALSHVQLMSAFCQLRLLLSDASLMSVSRSTSDFCVKASAPPANKNKEITNIRIANEFSDDELILSFLRTRQGDRQTMYSWKSCTLKPFCSYYSYTAYSCTIIHIQITITHEFISE